MEQRLQYEGKLLDRGHDDLRPVRQGARQLLRILVHGHHHTLGVLDLINRVLKLPVEHLTVGNHDDAVVNLLVPVVVEAGKSMGEP